MTLLTDTDSTTAVVAAIACDWNGTIVDDADRALIATNRTLIAFGLPPLGQQAFAAAFRLPLAEFFRDLGLPESDHDRVLSTWNRRLIDLSARLSPGVVTLLQTANHLDIPVGVVSAATPDLVHADALELGIAHQLAFISGDAADKAAVLHALAEVTPGALLYVGDTEYDILSAHQAGAVPIAFGNGYRPAAALRDARPAAVINDFSTLAAALRHTRLLRAMLSAIRTP